MTLAQKYGLTVAAGMTDATLELMLAFNERLKGCSGFLGRFEHLKNAIDLIWNIPRRQYAAAKNLEYDVRKHDAYIWNDWSELMMRGFCEWRETTTLTAGNSCLTADSRIFNPLNGRQPTIRELMEFNLDTIVMTLHGAELASVPFSKGIEDVVKITLSDGSSFQASSSHRVLTSRGYVSVGSLSIGSPLFGYEPIPPASTLDSGLSIRVLDARGSPRKAEDSLADCRLASRFCDEQLQVEVAACLSSLPSQPDAQDYIFRSQSEFLHNPHKLQFDHLSSSHAAHQALPAYTLLREHASVQRRSTSWSSTQVAVQYPLASFRSGQVPESYRDEGRIHLPLCNLALQKVVSIVSCGRQEVFDLTVPSAAHYFAEGAIHHNSWKTTSAALYGLCAWYASPHNTSVVITSTTLAGLRKRIWKEMVRYHSASASGIGHINPTDYAIRFTKGDDTSGVYGFATGQQEGDVKKAVGKIIGYHNTYVIAIVDEMQATNAAIVDSSISLKAGSDRFQFIGLGNADSELDPHGQMSEPVDGWDSISVESEQWETKKGICIHMDGLDSPRVKEGDEFYTGLLKASDIEDAKRDGGEDTPAFWQFRRGFWAPQGVAKTVLSMAMITKGHARDKAIWVGDYKIGAALDPSFEGRDRCVLRFYHCGEIDGGGTVMACKEMLIIKVAVSSEEPIHYQIARQVREECVSRGVAPDMFALDSTGEGGGLASIISREWGMGILLVEFGGRPSQDPVSENNPKRADLEYDRKITELCFRFRTLVLNGQVRELDLDTAGEFCQRKFGMKGNFMSVETKTDMKVRTRKSPDLMDDALIGAELFRRRGLLGASMPQAIVQKKNWIEQINKHDVSSDYSVAIL